MRTCSHRCLFGRRFCVVDVLCRSTRALPYFAELTGAVLCPLIGSAGPRAGILGGGVVCTGDQVRPAGDA